MNGSAGPRLKVNSFLELTRPHKIVNAALPKVAILTLGPNGEGTGEWSVQSGDIVEEEQVVGSGPQGKIFSPIPGRVIKITKITLPNEGETIVAAIALEGSFKRTGKSSTLNPWEEWSSTRVFEMLDYFSYLATSSSLEAPFLLDPRARVKKLIVNLLQPEPYQTGWYHLSIEESQSIVTGIKIIKKLYSPSEIEFAIQNHPKDYAQQILSAFGSGSYTVLKYDTLYPSAHSKLLSGSKEHLILDPESLVSLANVVCFSCPQIETYVTVSGSGVAHPGVYRVRVGTPISALLSECGVVEKANFSVVLGGPFRGAHLKEDFMVTRMARSLLVLSQTERRASTEHPCIRCSACVDSCPVSLNPIRLYEGLREKDESEGLRLELHQCLECGICSAVCPSRIPLLHQFQLSRKQR